MSPRKALISGASLAGPALAHWLAVSGWDVTVVERAGKLRLGGYPIDVRGSAAEIASRMGIYDQMVAERYRHPRMELLAPDGRVISKMSLGELTASANSIDVELTRGALTRLLHDLTKERVDYVFGDSVASLRQTSDGVEAEFENGAPQRFDIVVGADGIHSTTRRLLFGPEEEFVHHLGPYVAIWDLPAGSLTEGAGYVYTNPGRSIFAEVQQGDVGRVFAAFLHPKPGSVDLLDPEAAVEAVREAFRADRWAMSSRLIETMVGADDVFFDTVSQVRTETWHRGRAVLLGDAAFAPSFLSGQGTSMALMGAYVLASELATHEMPEEAFEAYGAKLRPFVLKNQALALRKNTNVLPRTEEDLRTRNRRLRAVPWIKRLGLLRLLTREVRDASNDIDLDGYGIMPRTTSVSG